MNVESDGIDDAIEQALRAAMMGAARAGEQLARLREASARKAEATSMKEAAEFEARLQAQQAEARTVYGQVSNPDWWDRAEHKDIVHAYETAHAWRDRDPQAEAAINTTHQQVKERYNVDLPANPDAARAAMADADRFYANADRQNERSGGDRQAETDLLRDAAFEDRLAEQARQDGNPEADSSLRDTESVPLDYLDDENVPAEKKVATFFEREVAPHVPDAWVNESICDEKDKEVGVVGYEINFNRYFYNYQPPRELESIEADIKAVEEDVLKLLQEVAG